MTNTNDRKEKNVQEEQPKKEYKYILSVRFDNSKKAYNFGTNEEIYKYGDKVVVETVRGLEIGEAISDLRDSAAHNNSLTLKPVIRKASEHDLRTAQKNKDDCPEALRLCQQCIDQLKLEMYLISAEYTLDRSKVIFTYVADDRVDFRELLKQLAAIFKCRIDLRQIGPRDKAKIVGGLGCCGMETCCSRFLEDFDIVSINMAKNQLLALNPQKLSGQCGKLMCCLKFEDEAYSSLRVNLPKMNSAVYYKGEKYRITSMNLLSDTAHISNSESSVDLTLDELREIVRATNAKKAENNNPNNG
ncbi:MAG: stage 0 sporulation protein [Erysipelotrichaceae bacterium]|nr:stage 0 sporulation protein [Erysipelotrichaceae bacterium]